VHLHCWATSPLADAQCAPTLGLLPRLLPKEICPGIHLHSHTTCAYKSERLQCTTYSDGMANNVYILVLFCNTYMFDLCSTLGAWLLYRLISTTISTYLDLGLQMEPSAIWEGTAILRTYQTTTLYILANMPDMVKLMMPDVSLFHGLINLCCPLTPGACVSEACLRLVWRTLATV